MTDSVLLIDDDEVFLDTLGRRLERAGYRVVTATTLSVLTPLADEHIDLVLLDLMLGDSNGLDAIPLLVSRYRPRQLIVLTGYASIATTVEAIKRGATNYLAKPVDTRQLLNLLAGSPEPGQASPRRLTPAQLEWEHIQRVLGEHDGNVSLTARALGMHRRTLQRKLKKHSPLR